VSNASDAWTVPTPKARFNRLPKRTRILVVVAAPKVLHPGMTAHDHACELGRDARPHRRIAAAFTELA
jgi:hypothetical protein